MSQDQMVFLIPVLSLIFSAIGAFSGSYLGEKGKNFATKEDVGRITSIVEQVKTEISHQDWTKREWTNIRRLKLEELLTHVSDLVNHITEVEEAAMRGKAVDARNPMVDFDTNATLYFPELRSEIDAFRGEILERQGIAIKVATSIALANAARNVERVAELMDAFHAALNAKKLLVLAANVRKAARSLLLIIMSAGDGSSTRAADG